MPNLKSLRMFNLSLLSYGCWSIFQTMSNLTALHITGDIKGGKDI